MINKFFDQKIFPVRVFIAFSAQDNFTLTIRVVKKKARPEPCQWIGS